MIVAVVIAAAICATLYLATRPSHIKHRDRRVVLVTGCDQGFGYDTARRLAAVGFRVYAACLTDAGAKRVVKDAEGHLTAVVCNVTSDAAVRRLRKRMQPDMKRFGGLFALVNNAGIVRGFIADCNTLADYQSVMDVNFFGAVRTTLAFLQDLKRAQGRIVNVSSLAGLIKAPTLTTYTASKHALQAFSEGIRHELAPFNVQVCTVNPSFHGTGMVSGATEQFRALWAKVPAALKQQYGSEFAANRERVLNATYSCSGRPSRVVRRMVDLLMRDGSLPAREVVGSDPAALTAFLPESWMGPFLALQTPKPSHPELAWEDGSDSA